MDFNKMTDEALVSELAEKRAAADVVFALDAPTLDQVAEAEALVASISAIKDVQTSRATRAAETAQRFAAAKQTFSTETEEVEEDPEELEAASEESVEEVVEDVAVEEVVEDAAAAEAPAQAISASSAAKAVARTVGRPSGRSSSTVTVTAAQDVPHFAAGSELGDMEAVAKALINRTRGFSPYNAQAAKAANAASGGAPVLSKFGVASIRTAYDDSLVASAGNDYVAVRNAIKQDRFGMDTLTAGGWCAPSETVYSFLAGYVIDGLVTIPEVSAPRGGLMLTTGPTRVDQDDFGFTQTEAQAIAKTPKPFETIDCPDFENHRLDAIGYGYTIPILTQHAYPELITDALQYAGVQYAHKVNARVIADMAALSTAAPSVGYGATFTDTLEALSIVAVKERRKHSVGVNHVMEVVLPEIALEIFRADISRRRSVALDVVTDAHIAAEFAARKLAPQYVADWQDLSGASAVFPAVIDAMIYPAGTFIKAVEDVINVSAVYDAASLKVNEYTGVFFEQGLFVAKAGYSSSIVTIPVCTAGACGAGSFVCTPGS